MVNVCSNVKFMRVVAKTNAGMTKERERDLFESWVAELQEFHRIWQQQSHQILANPPNKCLSISAHLIQTCLCPRGP